VCPELIVSCLLAQRMNLNEALFLSGAEQFSDTKGYGKTLEYGGDHIDKTPVVDGVIQTHIAAIDALDFRSVGRDVQYSKEYCLRELIKSYCGFNRVSHLPDLPIATGNWGCGAFLGDREWKSIIQLLSASEAEKELHYYTFKDEKLATALKAVYDLLKAKNLTVGTLFQLLLSYENSQKKSLQDPLSFFTFLTNNLNS